MNFIFETRLKRNEVDSLVERVVYTIASFPPYLHNLTLIESKELSTDLIIIFKKSDCGKKT